MTDYVIMPSADYQGLCDKIREKSGKTDPIKSGDLVAEIEEVAGSGGGSEDVLSEFLNDTIADLDLSNVITIPAYACYKRKQLTNVSAPNTRLIHDYAFQNCTNLVFIELSDSLTQMYNGAFNGCTNLALTKLPESLTLCSQNSFYGCENLALTKLPSKITTLSNATFRGCKKLAITEIPSGVTYIGSNAFYGCTGLTHLTFKGAMQIQSSPFANCTGLKWLLFKVAYSYNNKIDANSFSGCTNITDIFVPWAEGAVLNAPWGATNATIHYGWDEDFGWEDEGAGYISHFGAKVGMTWAEFFTSGFNYDQSYYSMGGSGIGFRDGNRPYNDSDLVEDCVLDTFQFTFTDEWGGSNGPYKAVRDYTWEDWCGGTTAWTMDHYTYEGEVWFRGSPTGISADALIEETEAVTIIGG